MSGLTTPDWAEDLDLALAEIWRRLARAASDRRHAFHTLTVASIGLDGAPSQRTMVLRAVDPGERSLRLHTDRRSPKVDELAREPRLAVHGYDLVGKLQLRLSGRGRILTDGALVDSAWTSSQDKSRICYRVQTAPGTPTPVAGPIPHDTPAPSAGRDRFAVLMIEIDRIEWLYLATPFHRRGETTWTGQTMARQWLVP